jgi:hypothetical protein
MTTQEVRGASRPNGTGDVQHVQHRRHYKDAHRARGRGRRGPRKGHLPAHAPSREPGPQGSRPDDTLELRGNGGGQKQATVEATLKVRDEHEPGDYLCVAIQAYDSRGNMAMIKDPKPSRLFRIVNLGGRDDHKTVFLGWGD